MQFATSGIVIQIGIQFPLLVSIFHPKPEGSGKFGCAEATIHTPKNKNRLSHEFLIEFFNPLMYFDSIA